MKNPNSLFLLILFCTLNLFGQELTCEDFKLGEFYIPTDNANETVFYVYKDGELIQEISQPVDSIEKYVVIKKEKTQIEWKNKIGFGDPTHENIEWIDDCSYRLTYDLEKNKSRGEESFINGKELLIEKIKIVDRCMEYSATLEMPDGIKVVQKSKICKE